MVAHHPVMEDLSALVLDDNPTSLRIISKMLAKFHFKVLPFRTAEAALDFLRSGAAKEEVLDLILAEVHLSTIGSDTLANSELLHHILNELQVPLITMCAYDDENTVSECMTVGACFHVLKPLNTGSFNILRQKALQHKSRRATPEGNNTPYLTKSRMVSSSTPIPKEIFILERNSLSNPESKESEEPEGYSKKPGRFTWTIELHEKFLEAVEVLGDKFATPERILKQMNVKGLTSKQVASHLQKHRLRKVKAKQGGQCQLNARANPLSELIRSAHNAATSESITPRVAADIRGVYPSRLWTQMKKRSVEAEALKSYTYTCTYGIYEDNTKSVWDMYQKSLQKGSSRSSRRRSSRHQRFAKNKDVVRDEGVSNEAPKTAGKIGYGVPVESSCSSSLLTSLLDQVVENNLTEAASNNDKVGNTDLLEGIMNKECTAAMGPSDGWAHLQSNALLDDTNINSSAHMDLTVPSDGWGEVSSFWMSQLEGPQEQQNLGPEDLLQVDDAWSDALGVANQPSLINVDELMAQEAAVGEAPVYDPVVQFAQDDGLWSWSPGMLF